MRHVSYRILIVDDSEVFRRTAAQLLAKRGFESRERWPMARRHWLR